MWPFLIPPPLGQPHSIFGGTSACWLFLCFHNTPNSDMDYRICNVRTCSFVYMLIHTGVGHTNSESAQQIWLGKTQSLLLTGFEPCTFGSPVQHSKHWANPSPHQRILHCSLSFSKKHLNEWKVHGRCKLLMLHIQWNGKLWGRYHLSGHYALKLIYNILSLLRCFEENLCPPPLKKSIFRCHLIMPHLILNSTLWVLFFTKSILSKQCQLSHTTSIHAKTKLHL